MCGTHSESEHCRSFFLVRTCSLDLMETAVTFWEHCGADSLRRVQRSDVLFLDDSQLAPLDQSCLHVGICGAGGSSRVGPIAHRSRTSPLECRLARLAILLLLRGLRLWRCLKALSTLHRLKKAEDKTHYENWSQSSSSWWQWQTNWWEPYSENSPQRWSEH